MQNQSQKNYNFLENYKMKFFDFYSKTNRKTKFYKKKLGKNGYEIIIFL